MKRSLLTRTQPGMEAQTVLGGRCAAAGTSQMVTSTRNPAASAAHSDVIETQQLTPSLTKGYPVTCQAGSEGRALPILDT